MRIWVSSKVLLLGGGEDQIKAAAVMKSVAHIFLG